MLPPARRRPIRSSVHPPACRHTRPPAHTRVQCVRIIWAARPESYGLTAGEQANDIRSPQGSATGRKGAILFCASSRFGCRGDIEVYTLHRLSLRPSDRAEAGLRMIWPPVSENPDRPCRRQSETMARNHPVSTNKKIRPVKMTTIL